jgi:hypothetical protein
LRHHQISWASLSLCSSTPFARTTVADDVLRLALAEADIFLTASIKQTYPKPTALFPLLSDRVAIHPGHGGIFLQPPSMAIAKALAYSMFPRKRTEVSQQAATASLPS